ncbi:MAG: hypothetical protein LBR28_00230 [Bacteroidales bacterium]|jgi:hypothetical protein|nr:hypothetical protein [Bacteroidales bacterium]
MKRIIFTLFCLVFTIETFAQASDNIPVGKWREHLSYYSTHAIVNMGEKMLLAGESSLFFIDKKTEKMERFSKVAGLSDAGVNLLGYDKNSNTVIITYSNSNIDIVQGTKIYNISDIRLKTIEGSKEINQIIFDNGKAYLACGFGIVVLDLKKHEINDTWFIGNNSSAIKVLQIAINDTAIFAATKDFGILYAPKSSHSLAVSDTWKTLPNLPVTTNDTVVINNDTIKNDLLNVTSVFSLPNNDLVIGMQRKNGETDIFKYNGNFEPVWKNMQMSKLLFSEGKIIKLAWKTVTVYDTAFARIGELTESPEWNVALRYNSSILPLDINDAVMDGDKIWFAHQNIGGVQTDVYKWHPDAKEYYPNGPLYTSAAKVKAAEDGTIYVAPTAIGGWQEADLFMFDGYEWSFLTKTDGIDTLFGICDMAVDPLDENHLFLASWWNGIIEVRNNRVVKIWNDANTNGFMQRYYGVRCVCVDYDKAGNLLVANALSSYGIVAMRADNKEWTGFSTSDMIGVNQLITGFVKDSITGYILIYGGDTKIILLDNYNNALYIDPNNGAKDKTNTVRCMVQDMDGEIWIGTEKGIKVIYSLVDAFKSNNGQTSLVECNNIVYDDNGVLQYLLNSDNVLCIMVDGANQKWIGTERNGIYVYNSNGSKELHHFTAENSPLLSNRVLSMAQNPLTGEVFIATDRGVVSYKAESTKGAVEANDLTVFPNPVRPDYTGEIAIRGFVANSDVRITDVSGNLVRHLKSVGGTAIWDGCNMNKEKVKSGVYLIFGSANEGSETTVGKVLIIR